MKFAVIGDPHLGCTKYTDKRTSDFSGQFNRAIDEALRQKVNAVFVLGDVFDSSAYRRSVDNFASCLGEVAESLTKLRDAGIDFLAIAGNHEYGRGRKGGELRILSDLKIINFLDDEIKDCCGFNIAGISWKSDIESFRTALKKLGKPQANSILLIHQFCEGSKLIPPFVTEIGRADLNDWPIAFTGHHHIYEDMGYVVTPGSLEIHSVNEIGQKGFVIYDTDTNKHAFIGLPPSREIKFVKINGGGKSPSEFQKTIENWIRCNASTGALLVIQINGTLSSGRSTDVDWRSLRSLGYQFGCLKVHFEGGLQDEVRTAPEIRSSVNFNDFIKKRFPSQQEKAIKYFESLREKGDEFSTEILDRILAQAGGRS